MKRLRAKKPHPKDADACDTYAAEMQLAENDREAWGCPGPMPASADADLASEARYAADVMGLEEPFDGCPLREVLRPSPWAREVQSACAATGETLQPETWCAVTGRYPSSADVDAWMLVRRAQGDAQRSDDEIRERKRKQKE